MQHTQYGNAIAFDDEVDGIRKSSRHGAADIVIDLRVNHRLIADCEHDRVDLVTETVSQAG